MKKAGEVRGRFVEDFLKGKWGGGGEVGWGGAGLGRGRVVDGRRSTQFNKEHSKVRKRRSPADPSLPSVVLDHVS